MKLYKSHKGQGWTMDYLVSFLIFTIAIILAAKILTNTFPSNDFEDIERSAVSISEHLMGKGNPNYWGELDVVRIGLTSSKNRLSQAKLDNIILLNYTITKRLFGSRYDYVFYFQDKNLSLIGIGDECALGSDQVTEVKNLYNELRPVAYYYKDESLMSGEMTRLGAVFYDADNNQDVDDFYENLGDYEFIMMEHPQLDIGGAISDEQKIKKLENFVKEGGKLFLSENVSLNMSGVGFGPSLQFDGEVTSSSDTNLQLTTGTAITDSNILDNSMTLDDQGAGLTILADYDISNEPWIATWRIGMGSVYYFATIDAVYDPGVSNVPMNLKVGAGADSLVNRTRANCTSISFDNIVTENMAKVERLSVYNSDIVKLVVVTWT